MQQARYVRQVVVENRLGAQYCAAHEGNIEFEVLSGKLPMPGRAETLTAVRMPGSNVPLLKVTRTIDRNRQISTFVAISAGLASGLLPIEIRSASMLHISLTDGTDLLVVGTPDNFDNTTSEKYIIANAVAGDVPLRVQVAVPFDVLRAEYSQVAQYCLPLWLAGVFSFWPFAMCVDPAKIRSPWRPPLQPGRLFLFINRLST